MTLSTLRNQKGFTLIELLMVILLIGILSVISITVLPDSVNESRFNQTIEKMNQLRNAMIGNPEIREGSTRTSFGYLGDVGAIPAAISSLLTIPGGVSAYATSTTARFGMGWNGLYLTGANTNADYTKDAWGTAFVYTPGASPPTLVSRGADLAAGGTGFDQDITVNLPTELTTATVSGFICQSGGPFASSAQVELNTPDGLGALTQTLVSLVPVDKGQFSFAAVPMGVRSISVYVPSKAAATQTIGPVLITVSQINFSVPCHLIDISP